MTTIFAKYFQLVRCQRADFSIVKIFGEATEATHFFSEVHKISEPSTFSCNFSVAWAFEQLKNVVIYQKY